MCFSAVLTQTGLGMTDKNTDDAEDQADTGRSRRVFRFLTYWGAVAAIWAIIGVFGLIGWYAMELPDVQSPDYAKASKGPSIQLLYADGKPLATRGGRRGNALTYPELPKSLVEAVVATEDRRFFDHLGIDVIGLARAAAVNLMALRVVQGGSTISQQLAKNAFLTPERSFRRKLLEVMMAFWLEAKYEKTQILSMYLNRVYLGAGTYGVDAAARRYFRVAAKDLTLEQSAIIAGLLKAPTRYAPSNNPKAARKRASVVIENMLAAGYLTTAQAGKARNRLAKTIARVPSRASSGQASGSTGGRYFADWIHEQLADYVSQSGRSLIVQTTLDRKLQQMAERAVEKSLAGEGRKVAAGEAALVAMTDNGAVRAMVGGRDYGKSQFNRAVSAHRQAGSTFKLFVYLAGLEHGFRPDTVFSDRPVTVGKWKPRNFSAYKGRVSFQDGLSRSLNSVAVQVSEKAGREQVIEAAVRLGLRDAMKPHPSIALGVATTTPLEITSAYATIAAGGEGNWSWGISEVRDNKGEVLYQRSGAGPGQVMEPETAAALDQMLTATVRTGTGRAARLDRPAAGKTGTSQDHRDAWFVGYTAHLVAGVWVGNDNGSPMKKVTGGGLPARIWRRFMNQAHKGITIKSTSSRPATVRSSEKAPAWKDPYKDERFDR
jgi:penicillin-binding protein 1A